MHERAATRPEFTVGAAGPATISRTTGDLLVTYDFGGSGTPTIGTGDANQQRRDTPADGVNTPSGAITVNCFAPSHGTWSGTPAYTETVSVTGGNGTYTTSND